MILGRRPDAARRLSFLGSAAASVLTAAVAVSVLRSGVPAAGVLFLHRASGFTMAYAVDGLSAWFLLILSTLAASIAVFSVAYIGHGALRARSAFSGGAFTVLVGAIELVFVSADVITFLFAWELMTLTNVALVATEHESRAARRAAYVYLVMSHVATACLIGGFMVLSARAGSLAFPAILSGTLASGAMRHVLFGLFFVGFGVKAGIIPLHVWLPEAHPAAPSNVSALMSSVVIKAGIYGIVRVCGFGLGTPALSWGIIIVVLGGLSAALGVLYALMQHDLKRLLAYHSIENIGIILLGLGAGMMALSRGRADVAALGIAAALFHVMNHAMFKGLLFLGAGSVVTATGTRQIEHFGGLLRRMPWTGLFFLVGAMAISGLPPLNGFASEWLTFQAFLFGFGTSAGMGSLRAIFPVGGAMLALTTALAAACFVKAFGITFLALPRSREAEVAHESPIAMLVPQAFLAIVCVALGLLPGVVLRTLDGVMVGLPGLAGRRPLAHGAFGMISGRPAFDHVSPVVFAAAITVAFALAVVVVRSRRAAARTVPTWGCGGQLNAQTEYTATAFSKPLMMIFRAVYRPTRQVEAAADVSPYFPTEVRYRASIEPTFERYVYEPLVRAVLRIANGMKVLQAGSLHAYLAYVLVLGVLLLFWLGGTR